MKNQRWANHFLELLLDKIPEIVIALKDEWSSSLEPLVLQLTKATKKEQMVDIANEIYELGSKTKAKHIFNEIYKEAVSKSESDEPMLNEWYPEIGMPQENSIPKPFVLYARAKNVLSEVNKTKKKKPTSKGAKQKPKSKRKPKEAERFTNIGLFDATEHEKERDRNLPLELKTTYYLKINIGNDEIWDSEREKSRTAFPSNELLPEPDPQVGGHWLDVIATSEDVNIRPEQEHHKIFLPESGNGWICKCKVGEKHSCNPDNREDYLYIPFTTPDLASESTIRIGIYLNNNLLQCRLLTTKVGIDVPDGEHGYWSVTDYTLTHTLRNIETLSPRTINIFTNENSDGRHRVILVGIENDESNNHGNMIYHNSLTEGQLGDLLKSARKTLHDTHRIPKKNPFGKVIEGEFIPLFDKNHAKGREAFIEDLKNLAFFGRMIWTELFNLPDALTENLDKKLKEGKATIQIGQAVTDKEQLYYLWSIIYDIELDLLEREKWVPCKVLDNWKPGVVLGEINTTNCPHSDTHDRNTICPFGFWGIKHIIEQPPSVPKGYSLQKDIKVSSDGNVDMAVGYANLPAWKNHLKNLRQYKLNIFDEPDKQDLLDVFAKPGIELLYFFCHGRRYEIPGTERWMAYLEIGDDEKITVEELISWRKKYLKKTWASTAPLVFINGCHTAELTPDALANITKFFIDSYASGVIGTEVTVADTLASEIAESIFSYIAVKDKNVGEAIRSMRHQLLSKGSVMGLAYTPYCSSELHLQKS